MLSQLRDPIRLKMKKRLPDGEGGWIKTSAGEVSVWALVRPLSPSKTDAVVEITIRDRPDLLEISQIIWNKRTLTPLTQPHLLEKPRGYLSFQATLLIEKE